MEFVSSVLCGYQNPLWYYLSNGIVDLYNYKDLRTHVQFPPCEDTELLFFIAVHYTSFRKLRVFLISVNSVIMWQSLFLVSNDLNEICYARKEMIMCGILLDI